MKTKTGFFNRVIAVLAMCIIASAPARADITINVAYAGSEDSDYGTMTEIFKKHVERLMPGVEVKHRCCASLITEDEAFKAMQTGSVDMAIITSNNVAPHYPPMDSMTLPYIFRSPEHGYKVLDGPIGRDMQKDLEEKTGVSLIAWSAFIYRDFYNTVRPINTMADIKGIKIRVPKNEVMLAAFQAFGAAPIALPWSETPPALQTGTVEGGDNGSTFIRKLKFYEIADNLAILEHFLVTTPLFASSRLMNKLTPEQRAKLREAGRETDKEFRSIIAQSRQDDIKFLTEEGGMKVTYPDKTDFIAAAQKMQDEWLAEKDDDIRNLVLNIRNTK